MVGLGPIVVGVCGSPRVLQLLVHHMCDVADNVEPTVGWMVGTFVERLRACLSDGGALKTDLGITTATGNSHMLVGVGPRIFTVWSDFQVETLECGYAATGNGYEVALGALHVLRGRRPTDQVRLALEASSQHVGTVGPPFTVLRARRLPGS